MSEGKQEAREQLGTCDLVSRPHRQDHCGEGWRPLAARQANLPSSFPEASDHDTISYAVAPQGKAQPESGEMGQEAGISLEEINAAITGHDFSAADPQVNFWVNRAIWLRDQHCREIEQNDVALIAHLADWICEVDGYSRQGLIDRINVCFNGLLVTHPAFQRGQQAMAEKAEQLANKWQNERAIDYEPNGVTEQGKGFEAGLRICAIELRGLLASAAPPQGEAEKEGRT